MEVGDCDDRYVQLIREVAERRALSCCHTLVARRHGYVEQQLVGAHVPLGGHASTEGSLVKAGLAVGEPAGANEHPRANGGAEGLSGRQWRVGGGRWW